MKVQQGGNVDRILQSAQHKLFVEGDSDEAIDPVVVGELLKNNGLSQVEVRSMGACDHVRSAAQALIRHHPAYYFLIDRDDQDQATIDNYWRNFPDPATHNLLIWRKRELENYFIDPNYLEKSPWLSVGKAELKQRILEQCNQRLFIDAANLTLLKLHRQLQRPLGQLFSNPGEFSSKEAGARQLEVLPQLDTKRQDVANGLRGAVVESCYEEFIGELSGGSIPLCYGAGSWLERLSGKEIFRSIAGPCFKVTAANGSVLQGKEQHKQIAKSLLTQALAEQPEDFQQLFHLMEQRVIADR